MLTRRAGPLALLAALLPGSAAGLEPGAVPSVALLQGHRYFRATVGETVTESAHRWTHELLPALGFNAVEIPLAGHVTRFTRGADCIDGCDSPAPGSGIWPVPFDASRLDRDTHGGPLAALEPFRGTDIGVLLTTSPLTDVFRAEISPDCPDERGLVVGSEACACELSYDDVLDYLEGLLLAFAEWSASAPGGSAWDRFVALRPNMEYDLFPRLAYPTNDSPEAPGVGPGVPGVCDETVARFNAWSGLDAGARDGYSLAGFLNDVTFDFPELADVFDAPAAGVIAFGAEADETGFRAVAQEIRLDPSIDLCRVDVKLARLGPGNPVEDPWILVCGADAQGRPDFSRRLRPRMFRRNSVPHESRGFEWVPMYVDPLAYRATFGGATRVFFVVVAGSAPRAHNAYGVEIAGGGGDDPLPGRAFELDAEDTGRGIAPVRYDELREIDGDIRFRAYRSLEPDSRAHASFVDYQVNQMGRIFRDVRQRLDRHALTRQVEIWPFCHVPDVEFAGTNRREWYGFDYRQPDAFASIGGIFTWVPYATNARLSQVGPIHSATQLTAYGQQLTDRLVWTGARMSFLSGGMNLWSDTYAPEDPVANEAWFAEVREVARGVTLPIQRFAPHYLYASRGHYADSTSLAGTHGNAEVWSLSCPAGECQPDEDVGHALVISDSESRAAGAGTVEMLDAIPSAWWSGAPGGPLGTDSVTVLHVGRFPDAASEAAAEEVRVLCGRERASWPLELGSWYHPGSHAFVRHRPAARQPGELVGVRLEPPGCCGEEVQLSWEPIPSACIEQHGLSDVRAEVLLERRSPEGWEVAARREGPDDGTEALVATCGGVYLPEHRVRLVVRAREDGMLRTFVDRSVALDVAHEGSATCLALDGNGAHLWVRTRGGGEIAHLSPVREPGGLAAEIPLPADAWSEGSLEVVIGVRGETRLDLDRAVLVAPGGYPVGPRTARVAGGAEVSPLLGDPASARVRLQRDGMVVMRFDAGSGEQALRVEAVLDAAAPPGDEGVWTPEEVPAARLVAIPNPFRAETLLRVDLSEDAAWSFEVFDVSGRRVATLLEAWLPRGRLEVAWDGRRPDGERLPAGVYFVRGLRGGRPVGRPMRLVLTG